MAFINPSDILEEDAADLIFPKDNFNTCDIDNILIVQPNRHTKYITKNNTKGVSQIVNIISKSANMIDALTGEINEELCEICHRKLLEPFIKCSECFSLNLCLYCFASGKEYGQHLNSHSYIIIQDDIEIFNETGWTVADERKLLRFLETFGIGNWEKISKEIGNKFSSDECREHYLKYYFCGIFGKLVNKNCFTPLKYPYYFKIKSVDPPRYNDDSFNVYSTAGYRCARGDFDFTYDRSAESIVSYLDIKEDDDEDEFYRNNKKNAFCSESFKIIHDELKCALFRAYNNRLKERHRRYKIMRDHGLISANKTQAWLSQYSDMLNYYYNNQTKLNAASGKCSIYNNGKITSLMQLTDGIGFDFLLESLQNFYEKQKYLFMLYDYRVNGITTLCCGKIFQKLKLKRLNEFREKKIDLNLYDWRALLSEQQLDTSNSIIMNAKQRKKAAPIEIIGFPGYDKLTDSERQLCSIVRILPLSYLDFKNILIQENNKLGYLRLAEARRLIKIDVNKTRQIYDFLCKNGLLTKCKNL